MKQILVISGKGGTGKTVLTASFAALCKNKVMADCDVDAADLHLILHPKIKEKHEFKSGKTAVLSEKLCNKCGKCKKVCRFDAVEYDKKYFIDSISCEGCGLCARICPKNAITMEENRSGDWFISETKFGSLIHAKLGIAEENSGKLVAQVRKTAKDIAENQKKDFVIIDGPPGIGCPVTASLTGVDFALVVTEPTVSGIHDMKRVLELAGHFKIKCGVVINKFDLNTDAAKDIEDYCAKLNIEVMEKIPFSKEVSKSIVNGVPAVTFCKDGTENKISDLWSKIEKTLI